jgi:ubiquinone/menaquinone biosynthesis C-methylase UbiE
MAWSYDLVAWLVSLGRWKSWVNSVLPYLEGPWVLEMGHGPGHLQVLLNRRAVRVVGLDLSRQMGRQAYRRIWKTGFIPQLLNGYAQNLPFPSAAFHQVVATFPTTYISHPQTLAEIHRILTPGGRLVVLPFAWITGHSIPDRLAAWLFRVTEETPATARSSVAERFSVPFRKAGFDVQADFIDLGSSSVLLFLCTPQKV